MNSSFLGSNSSWDWDPELVGNMKISDSNKCGLNLTEPF
jgi:hypothetical protein